MNIPAITADQMREVDRLMIEDYGIQLIQMMENAGRNLAALARHRFLEGNPVGKRVLVLAGRGGNGGGGLVAARRLHNWGAEVKIITSRPGSQFVDVPGHQMNILTEMGLSIIHQRDISELPETDLILDALIGYSLRGAPSGETADLIGKANLNPAPILSLDVPSGVDSTTGQAFDPHMKATATLTLALPKTGLLSQGPQTRIGELYLADISVPPNLYEALGLSIGSIFSEKELIRI